METSTQKVTAAKQASVDLAKGLEYLSDHRLEELKRAMLDAYNEAERLIIAIDREQQNRARK